MHRWRSNSLACALWLFGVACGGFADDGKDNDTQVSLDSDAADTDMATDDTQDTEDSDGGGLAYWAIEGSVAWDGKDLTAVTALDAAPLSWRVRRPKQEDCVERIVLSDVTPANLSLGERSELSVGWTVSVQPAPLVPVDPTPQDTGPEDSGAAEDGDKGGDKTVPSPASTCNFPGPTTLFVGFGPTDDRLGPPATEVGVSWQTAYGFYVQATGTSPLYLVGVAGTEAQLSGNDPAPVLKAPLAPDTYRSVALLLVPDGQ